MFEINVPYEQLEPVQGGSRCILELPDGKRLRATVQATLATMDEVSQSEEIVATAADAPFLPEGMNVKAVFRSGSTPDSALLPPHSAVQRDETLTSYWVMKLIDDSTAIKSRSKQATVRLTASKSVGG